MTAHALFTDQPSKAVCGVHLNNQRTGTAASTSLAVTCDRCALKVLRSLQLEYPGVSAGDLPDAWPPGVGGRPGPLLVALPEALRCPGGADPGCSTCRDDIPGGW